MKKLAMIIFVSAFVFGCGGSVDEATYEAEAPAAEPVLLEVEAPPALEVAEPKEVTGEDDWEARVHNKNIEVVQVINIIQPIAAYITVGFEQYGSSFSETLHEEWSDTQVQLTRATTLYGSCQERMANGEFLVSVDADWHGACVLARSDGLVVGMMLVGEDAARVALLSEE